MKISYKHRRNIIWPKVVIFCELYQKGLLTLLPKKLERILIQHEFKFGIEFESAHANSTGIN